MSGERRQALRRRLERLASGTHEGPLGPEDIEALRFMASVYEEASHAAWKLWTMYGRGETQRKAELDWLIGLFQDPEWTGVDDPPDPKAARARAAVPKLLALARYAAERGEGDAEMAEEILREIDAP